MAISIDVIPPKDFQKQLRFAASRALNDSAFDVRRKLVASLDDHFTIRNKFSERGFRVVKAKKSNLRATVGSTREYLVDQVKGGRRHRGSIPTRKLRGSPKRTVRRSRWPRALLGRKERHFMLDARAGGASLPGALSRHAGRRERLIFRRMGRKGRRLRLLWVVLDHDQRVTPRWPFQRIAMAEFGRVYPHHLPRRLAEALRTAR